MICILRKVNQKRLEIDAGYDLVVGDDFSFRETKRTWRKGDNLIII